MPFSLAIKLVVCVPVLCLLYNINCCVHVAKHMIGWNAYVCNVLPECPPPFIFLPSIHIWYNYITVPGKVLSEWSTLPAPSGELKGQKVLGRMTHIISSCSFNTRLVHWKYQLFDLAVQLYMYVPRTDPEVASSSNCTVLKVRVWAIRLVGNVDIHVPAITL